MCSLKCFSAAVLGSNTRVTLWRHSPLRPRAAFLTIIPSIPSAPTSNFPQLATGWSSALPILITLGRSVTTRHRGGWILKKPSGRSVKVTFYNLDYLRMCILSRISSSYNLERGVGVGLLAIKVIGGTRKNSLCLC